MAVSVLPWVIAAVAAFAAGALAVRPRQPARTGSVLAWLGVSLLGMLAGLVWRAWQAHAWPGPAAADALALLAGGALVVTAWIISRDAGGLALALTLWGIAALLAMASALGWRGSTVAADPAARLWLLGLRALVASIGLGGWLPVLMTSAAWRFEGLRSRSEAGSVSPQPLLPARGTDPGRAVAAFCLPWLTGALLIGVIWNLVAHAEPWRGAPTHLYVMAAWLLGMVYLQATSRRQIPAWVLWLAPVIALATWVLGLLSMLTASSWL